MSDTFEHIELLIVRALENSLDKAGTQELQAWLEEDESHRRYYEEIRKTWEVTGGTDVDHEPDVDANWDRFTRRLQAETATSTPVIRSLKWYAVRAAAAVLLLGGAATLYFTTRTREIEIDIHTAAAQKTVLQLPDGTRVFLNEQSHLRYAKQFEGEERAVYLEGEAFFDVAHEEQRPFIVYTDHTRTQVLGTTFDVRAYKIEPVTVSVVSGKVAVSDKKEEKKVILTPGRRATFREGSRIEESAIDAKATAWKKNMLYFDNAPFNNVVEMLEAYYDIKIKIEDPKAANYQFQGHFENDAKLEDVLQVLTESANLTLSREQNVYVLKAK